MPVRLNTALTDLYVEDGVVRGIYVRDTDRAANPLSRELIRARRGSDPRIAAVSSTTSRCG